VKGGWKFFSLHMSLLVGSLKNVCYEVFVSGILLSSFEVSVFCTHLSVFFCSFH
jgi:hypothetical protein